MDLAQPERFKTGVHKRFRLLLAGSIYAEQSSEL